MTSYCMSESCFLEGGINSISKRGSLLADTLDKENLLAVVQRVVVDVVVQLSC